MPWQQLLDEAPVAISIVDPTGHQVACNREYALLLGYTLDEAESLDVAAITRADDQQWTRSYLDQLGSGQLERYVTDKVYVRKDGSTFTGRLTSRALRDEDGVCTHLIGTIVPVESRPKIGVGIMAVGSAMTTVVTRVAPRATAQRRALQRDRTDTMPGSIPAGV